MVKPISTNTLAQAAQQYGHEPILILAIEWGGTTGTKYYADKALTLGTISAEGKLLSVSSIASSKKQDNVGMVSVIKVTLDDLDDSLKTLIDDYVIEYKSASIYQHFEGLTQADLSLLFKGNIAGPIVWSEGQRTLSFEIETKIRDNEVGFSAEPGSIQYLDVNSYDKPWPLCFGNVIHVPALRLITAPYGHLKYPFKGPRDETQPPTTNPYFDDHHFYLQDGEGQYFPQNVPCQVSIDGVIFSGTFTGDTFTVGEANLPRFTSLAFGPRDPNDPDKTQSYVAWLATPISIVNCYVYIKDVSGNTAYYRVVRQEGKKIWFNSKGLQSTSGVFHYFDAGEQIAEVAKNGRPGWAFTLTTSGQTGDGLLAGEGGSSYETPYQVVDILSRVPWTFQAGTEVSLWQPSHKDVYVANLIPSSAVVAVYSKRRGPKGSEEFMPIHPDYYVVNLNDTIVVNNAAGAVTVHPTTITFNLPLKYFEGQNWSEDIYVTLRSTVGPNTSDILKWLYLNYSSIVPDTASFDSVKTAIANYPSNFALFDKQNVISLCDEIAWQARCGILIDLGQVFLRYLSKEPAYDVIYNESNVKYQTFELTYTRTEDITTHFVAKWKTTYLPERQYQKEVVRSNNISQYGFHKREYNFYIYNIESLVKKSVDFWSHRYANSWRMAELTAAMEGVKLEIFDCVDLAFSDTSLLNISNIKTIVESTDFNPDDDTIKLTVWLPSLAGTKNVDPKAWLDDSGDTNPGDPTTKYSVNPLDYQYADFESRMWIMRQNIGDTVPAKVTSITLSEPPDPANADSTGTPMLVDIYSNGYGEDPTKSKVTATPIDPNNPPSEGDNVAVVQLNGKNYIVNPAGASFTPARISSTVTANQYKWVETTVPGGADKTGAVEKDCYEMNGSSAITANTFVFVYKAADGKYYFFFPVESCPTL